MKRHRKLLFPLITVCLVLCVLMIFDITLGLMGVNREYRLTTPDRMHRNDPELLFIERSNLALEVPIFPTLQAGPGAAEPYRVWHVKTNSKGMNEKEFSENKEAGTTRIISLGDSCTFGWGLPRKDSYVRKMDVLLKEKYPHKKIEVLNAGHTGFTSFQGKKLLKRHVLDWDPDYVTLLFGANDFTITGSLYPDKTAYEINQTRAKRIQYLLEKSNFYLMAKRGLKKSEDKTHKKSAPPKSHIPRVSLKDFNSNLQEMIDACSRNGVSVVLISQPHQLWTDNDERYYQKLMEVAARNNLQVVDCARRFSQLLEEHNIAGKVPNRLFIDGIHPDFEGSDIIARMVAESFELN